MSEPLDRDFKIRIPMAMYLALERLAEQRGPGTKIAPLIREAIHQVYFQNESHTPFQKPIPATLKQTGRRMNG